MNTNSFPLNDIAPTVIRLAGRGVDDADLKGFLSAIGRWPLAPFAADEFEVFVEDKVRGFALEFKDASRVAQSQPPGVPARTPVLSFGFFYSQGKDGYQQFPGALPFGVLWSETSAALLARLGPPKFTITNKKTGALQAYRWEIDARMLSANFKSDGTLGHVAVGIS